MEILQLGPIPMEEGAFRETGGVDTHVWELSNELSKRGHKVHLFADNYVGDRTTLENGIRLYGLHPKTAIRSVFKHNSKLTEIFDVVSIYQRFGVSRTLKMLLYYIHASELIRQIEPDIVHAHHLEYRFTVADLILHDDSPPLTATSHSIHTVTHGNPSQKEHYQWLLKRASSRCESLIWVSEHLKKDFEDYVGECRRDNVVIHNAVYMGNEEYPDKESNNTILFVGEFSERKGIFNLIDAITDVAKSIPDLEALFIGSNETAEVGDYIERVGISERCKVLGRVEDVDEYYQMADLLVVPSESESFGLVYIEAMAHGTPVVGTTAVPKSVIPTEEVGYRIQPNSVKELANVIVNGLQRDWSRSEIQTHVKQFSWDESIEQYEEHYNKLLK